MTKPLFAFLLCCLCLLTGCGRSREEAKVQAAYALYIQAFESGDPEALKKSTTEEMYPIAMVGLNAAKAFGVNLAAMHVAHSVDKIEGDVAYVNTESKFQGVTRHERVVLKRINGEWLVAGKQ